MSKSKAGYEAICRLDNGQEITKYLKPIHAKALMYIWKESKASGCAYPYEIAHALNPRKFPIASSLSKHEFFRFKNGEAYGKKKISEIVNEFAPIIQSSNTQGINDPFPLYIARDPEHEFTVIAIYERIAVINFIPVGDESTQEHL